MQFFSEILQFYNIIPKNSLVLILFWKTEGPIKLSLYVKVSACYKPQSAGINLQSSQSDSTPWTLTLLHRHIFHELMSCLLHCFTSSQIWILNFHNLLYRCMYKAYNLWARIPGMWNSWRRHISHEFVVKGHNKLCNCYRNKEIGVGTW